MLLRPCFLLTVVAIYSIIETPVSTLDISCEYNILLIAETGKATSHVATSFPVHQYWQPQYYKLWPVLFAWIILSTPKSQSSKLFVILCAAQLGFGNICLVDLLVLAISGALNKKCQIQSETTNEERIDQENE